MPTQSTAEPNQSTAGTNQGVARPIPVSFIPKTDTAGPSTVNEEEASPKGFPDEATLAEALLQMGRTPGSLVIPGVALEERRTDPPSSTLDPKDKGKGIMKEEPKKKKLTPQELKAAQEAYYEELARKKQEEWDAEEREKLAEIEAQKVAEEEKRLAGLEALKDEIEASEMYAAELQRKEQEELSIEEKSKLLVEAIAA